MMAKLEGFASSKMDQHAITASLDFESFVILPGTVNAWPGMQMLVKEEDTDSVSRPSSPHESDFSYLLESDPEQETQPEEVLAPESLDSSTFDPLDQPYLEMHHGRMSSSAPPFYHPEFMAHQFHPPEFPFTMHPMYFVPEGSEEGWSVRIKKKKKAGKHKKKHNKMNEGSPKAKKNKKKKNKKKDKAEEFDPITGQKKYKSKNKRHIAWAQRQDGGPIWSGVGGEFRPPPMDYTPPDHRSRSSSGTSDSWAGSFSGSPMGRKPDWLSASNPLPLYAQVF
jgi:hypothetical protein